MLKEYFNMDPIMICQLITDEIHNNERLKN